jgi:DNA primase
LSTRIKKLNILKQVLGSSYNVGEENLFFCPKCKHHKKKLSVNVDKDVFKCWVCEYHGRSLRRLIRSFGDFNSKKEWDELDSRVNLKDFTYDLFNDQAEDKVEQKVELPREFISLANRNLPPQALPALKYLKSRNITKQDRIRWKIGFCYEGEYAGRVIIPSFSKTGHCNYFVSRTYTGDWMKYKNPGASRDMIFNHLYVDWDSDLIIVEGVFDALVSGPNTVPILGSSLREGSQLFQEIVRNDTPVFLALDPDAEKKAMRLIKKLLEYDVEVYKIDIAPFNDVGEMSKDIFEQRKKDAARMSNDDYLLRRINSIR